MTTIKDMPVRASDRSKVRIFATVRVMHQTTRARVIDLSPTGMAFDVEKPIQAMAGQLVTVESEELGRLSGTVCWYSNGRLGIQYKLSTNALAQITSYFRFFHEEVRPVLRR
ncbi:PilZ domain-containing protein [Shinella yambaruensis]|uniref:Pilus protein PilZ n=1 Tax=Shinella yambaruensis TaxID=415996 RepID=A0ABQ5ZLY3_9HYPH|nr:MULTISPECIES: PilZ domain-containing protein [Shinella]CAI0336334.1 Pilus assembly protein PilZ [Rhizobiaceae bacterium]CAK7254873.1 Pilus assembly protein PilZ [Shinella sp. WSC3-e]MCJ8026497.1 PilZ domain-containing protein [Shinella yambaruensis]MCO5136631.1 PilZ domain-containing protein [Shinella sp.]MCU7982291.1 PilZ domain-containing protein [Shinella yambaruensis]